MKPIMCKCIKCGSLYPETTYPYNRQESCLCDDCVFELKYNYLKYLKLNIGDIVYTNKSIIENCQKRYIIVKGKLYDIYLINHWLALRLSFPTNNNTFNNLLYKKAIDKYHNFKLSDMGDLFKFTLKDLNTATQYNRNVYQLFNNENDAQQYCDKENKLLEFRRKQRQFKNYLYVDDIRQIPKELYNSYKCFQAFSYKQAITKLKKTKFSVIDLDHDLGEEKTGYDICKYIVENNIRFDKIRIHTSNPVGRNNMIQLLERYTNIPIEIY